MMKKLAIFLLVCVTVTSCGARTKQNASANDNDKKMGTIHLTKSEFISRVADIENSSQEWKYLGDRPAVVDFYATWCGPCKAIAPILEELADEYGDKIYIYKVDVDKEPDLAAAFGVQSIPTLLFIPSQGSPQLVTGAMPKPALEEHIRGIL